MMSRQRVDWCGLALLGITLIAFVAFGPSPATAQDTGTVRVARVAGHVEVLPKGQATWVAATVGTTLAVGAEIRAFEGGWAELRLVNGNSIVLAENSRLVVTRLEVDAQGDPRASVFHLVIGKVRASIAHAAITLIRFRESDFAITTPTAVAAARGTEWTTMFYRVNPYITKVAVHEGEVICSDLTKGTLIQLSMSYEATQCARITLLSRIAEQVIRSTSFSDTKADPALLNNNRTPNITDPSLGLIGAVFTSLPGPVFVNPSTPGNYRGPELTSTQTNLSETTSRRLR
jgi:hypothetical protein